ncbi:helix-turn-helix transcriptional regulator [Streptomyces iconiensis]|uniref:LuxR C-terminal-related transcriptional regulator n=1 Tax=Streptomyces iconiensis TaxID=1384038 RepID=A0ABT7A133_9ACTN|nr:LuxR C-terminal-related transcriptional regulator [Streptomyces iconiensis]MDJ1134769.1 LuxR C-terminal-related transcriptional regulator [Streptomyces iconiensis]
MSWLRSREGITIVGGEERDTASVVVLLTEVVDKSAIQYLQEFVTVGDQKAILVPNHLRPGNLLDAVRSGTRLIIPRDAVTDDRLAEAVLAVSRGHAEMPLESLSDLLNQLCAESEQAKISPRDVDVLRLMAEGKDTEEIAGHLNYSVRTIKHIIQSFTARFDLRNRTHAVAYAMRHGYIQ